MLGQVMSMAMFPDAATTAADEVKVREILQQWTFPPNVRGWELDFAEDYDGDPVAYITFRVDDALNPSKEPVRKVTDFSEELRHQLRGADLHYWPFFRFQPPVDATSGRKVKRHR
jgi:hypothetical protein